jgi:hypothetical protein
MPKTMTEHLCRSKTFELLSTSNPGSWKSLFHYYFPNNWRIVNNPIANPDQQVVVVTFISLQSIITVFSDKVTALHDQWSTILPLHGSLFKLANFVKMPLSILFFVKQHLPAPAQRVSFMKSTFPTIPF